MSGVKLRITRKLCGCDEIDCNRCTGPWVPPEKRSKAELIEDLADANAMNKQLRERNQKLLQTLRRVQAIVGPSESKDTP